MAKPTTLPRWATGGAALIVEPTEGTKDAGWVPGQKPPAQYENWGRRLIYDWLSYLNGLTNEALTWASAQVFSAKATFSAGATSSVAPTVSTDVARKFEVDAEATARAAAITSAVSPKANDSAVVHLTGNETVAGVKTFGNSPVFPAPTWTTLTPNAGNWTTGTGDLALAYWKDAAGVVHFRGNAATTGTPINPVHGADPLAVGCRPKAGRYFVVPNTTGGSAALFYLTVGGVLQVVGTPPANTTYYLDGISFVAEQ